jgi:hypothetical protein
MEMLNCRFEWSVKSDTVLSDQLISGSRLLVVDSRTRAWKLNETMTIDDVVGVAQSCLLSVAALLVLSQ